ncbi:MAG: hypothetical protein ABI782_05290 [Anaerolineaceae bacterium]
MGSKPPGSRATDILLEMPLAKHSDVVPAVEDRWYLLFIGGALLMAVGGGFVLAVLLSLAEAGSLGLEDRVPWLIQAHGWAQVQGWAGLFVAGMGLRLLPRFAGRKPIARGLAVPVFALLFSGVVLRTFSQSHRPGGATDGLFLAGEVLAAGGVAGVAGLVGWTLIRGRQVAEPWRWFAFAGASWWAIWALLLLRQGVTGAANHAYITAATDDATSWAVLLGAIGNFIWAVQSRSVPVFFGRKTPALRRALGPGIALNIGALAILASPWLGDSGHRRSLASAGFLLCGAALLLLPPLAGAVRGEATRLRPRARPAAKFVLWGNRFAMLAGALLICAAVSDVVFDGERAAAARDAARHAYGLGLVTLLIVGMAQLVAPFFALRRLDASGASLLDRGVWWCLISAATLRVATGLAADDWSGDSRWHASALAGMLGWLGLVLFVTTVIQAIRSEPRLKAQLAATADAARTGHR